MLGSGTLEGGSNLFTLGSAFLSAFFSGDALSALEFTVGEAALSLCVSLIFGIPFGFLCAALNTKTRRWAEFGLALPLLIPTVSAATLWTLVWNFLSDQSGIRFFGWGAVVIANAAYNIPWIAWCISRSVAEQGLGAYAQARSFGATRWQAWRVGVWTRNTPIRPALLEASIQAFAWSAMSFAVVLALGGGPPLETLEVALYSSVRFGTIDRITAIAIAVWQIVLVLGVWLGGFFILRADRKDRPTARTFTPARHRVQMTLVGPRLGRWILIACFIFVVPYVILLPGALSGVPIFGLKKALFHSTFLGLFAAAMAIMIALFWIWISRRFSNVPTIALLADLCAQIPAGISPITLCFGLWLLPQFDLAAGDVLLTASVSGAILGLLFSPFAFRILKPVSEQVRAEELWIARSLGASRAQSFWWVEFRKWKNPLLSAFALVFGASIGEVSVVLFFAHPDFVTLPALASKLVSHYHFEAAEQISLLLLGMGVGAYVLFDRLSHPKGLSTASLTGAKQ